MKTEINYDSIIAYEVVSSQKKGVHWGWWLLWLVLCWPALILVAIFHFSSEEIHNVVVKTKLGGKVILDEVTNAELGKIETVCAFSNNNRGF